MPANDFLPSTGVISFLRVPGGPGVRWDGGVGAGSEIGLHYDPLLGKLIVVGRHARRGDRAHAPRAARAHDRRRRNLARLSFARDGRSPSSSAARSTSSGSSAGCRRSPRGAGTPDGEIAVAIAAALLAESERGGATRAAARHGDGSTAPSATSAWRDGRAARRAEGAADGADQRDVAIDSIAAGGDGVARAEGIRRVRAALRARRRGRRATSQCAARSRAAPFVALVEPSPTRVESAVPALHDGPLRRLPAAAHATTTRSSTAKGGIIRDSHRAHRQARASSCPTVRAEPARSGAIGASSRSRCSAQGDALDRRAASVRRAARVFALRDCPITDERVVAIWRDDACEPRARCRSRPALRGAVRLDRRRRDVRARGRRRVADARRDSSRRVPALRALWWIPEKKRRRLMQRARQRRSARRVVRAGERASRRRAARATCWRACCRTHPATVIDGYSGAGDLALALARDGRARDGDRARSRCVGARGARGCPRARASISGKVEELLAALRCRPTSSCSIRRAPASTGA